jgi:hypothetical protein
MATNDKTTGGHCKLTGWWWTPLAVFWWGLKRLFIIIAVWLSIWKAWATLDSPDPLRISPETTLIIEPIAEDGLPDFAGALLDRLGRGTKSEDNGAIEFWQAVGTREIDPSFVELLFAEIGCPVPETALSMKPLQEGEYRERITEWLARSQPGVDPIQLEIQVDEFYHVTRKRRGAIEATPPLVEWVEENAEQLDLLHASARKPHFYSPPPNLLASPPPQLFDALLPAEQAMREAMVGLATRAALRIDQGDYDAAWSDIETILVFGERLTSKPMVVPQLVGVALRGIAFDGTELLIDRCDSEQLLIQIIERLDGLGEPQWIAQAHAFGEPLSLIDSLVCSMSPTRAATEIDLWKTPKAIEPNILLSEVRAWQDRLSVTANMPDRMARRRAAEDFEQSLDELGNRVSPWGLLSSVFTRAGVSRSIANIHVTLLMPATAASFAAEDRSCAQQRLTLLAAALKLHQLRHGEYPESLDALAPEPLAEIPLDPFTNKSFLYKRRDEGFVIWSLGRNGVDDGGSDQSGEFVNGEYAPIDWTGERPKPEGPDDVVVRLPVPALELPGVAE